MMTKKYNQKSKSKSKSKFRLRYFNMSKLTHLFVRIEVKQHFK